LSYLWVRRGLMFGGAVPNVPILLNRSTMIRATTILAMMLLGATTAPAQPVASVAPRDTTPIAVVREYVAAFNAKDLDAMMSHVSPGMVWSNVEGDSTTLGGRGADAFRRLLSGYFREVPTARSELLAVRALGPWVTTHERTRWSAPAGEAGGQSSVVVYEVRAGLVQRVWFYPAEP
jgi:hypothetical protein